MHVLGKAALALVPHSDSPRNYKEEAKRNTPEVVP